MSMLPAEIRQLPIDARLAIVGELWDSIVDDQRQLELSNAQKAEIDRRLQARQNRGDVASPWVEVKRRILGE
jgi:putative addiction module component (TIGR02574 family)